MLKLIKKLICKIRGHDMRWHTFVTNDNKRMMGGTCIRCGYECQEKYSE